jgi:hypothetical protein
MAMMDFRIGEGPEYRPFRDLRSRLSTDGWYFPPQKIPLAENTFLQAGKGAENAKEKSRQCFPCMLL